MAEIHSNASHSINSYSGSKDSALNLDTAEHVPIHHVGSGGEYVIIGKQKFYKHELMQAFGGTLNPGLAPIPKNKFGNPAPLGLMTFAVPTLINGLYNVNAKGIHTPNVIVGIAMFYGGVGQSLAGLWEMAIGNTFAATALLSYGAFWFLFGSIFIESFGILEAYGEHFDQMPNALGFYLVGWTIFSFMLWSLTWKSTIGVTSLFLSITLTFLTSAAGALSGNTNVARAGGAFGIITAAIGFYNAYSGIADPTNSYFQVKQVLLTKNQLAPSH